MARAVNRTLATALGISLLAHLLLLGSAGHWWSVPEAELAFPIEASLVAAAPPAPVAHREPARTFPVPAPPPDSPSPPPPDMAEPAPPPPPAVVPVPAPQPIEPPPLVSAPPPVVPEPPPKPASPPGRKAQRQLPGQLKIVYAVQTGEDGFVAGRATYLWHSRNGRYSLVNTVEATGLASLFISGRIVQLSEGEIGEGGLRPAQYWLQRKERKQESARFNWGQNQLMLGGDTVGVALTPQAQDLLSFPFQLAMTAREGEPDFNMGVTNGKRFREYGFHSLGRETLTLRGREVEALHLQGYREGEGSLDVWLDLARHGLPVQVRTLDQKGKVMLLVAEDIQDGG